MAKTKKFLLIDANSLIHRAYHALPPLTSPKGQLVNAVYGFANIFLKVLREHKPDYIAVCFDVAGGTFRDEIYADYKAGREEKPQEFHDQFDIIKEFLEVMNTRIFEKPGYEADDLIGTLSNNDKLKPQEKIKKIILTGDMDMLQLVDNDTEVERLKKGVSDTVVYTPKLVEDEFGYKPGQVIDYKALRGDASDNIPGVPGVGEKTATQLIKDFGTIEELYKHINDCKHKKAECKLNESLMKKLFDNKPEARLSKKLAAIKRDVPLKFSLEDLEIKPYDIDQVAAYIQRLGFRSLLSRLPKQEVPSLFGSQDQKKTSKKPKNPNYILIDDGKKFIKFIEELKRQKIFALDTETSQLEAIGSQLVGMSFSWKAGYGYYLPILSSRVEPRHIGTNREISGECQIRPAFTGNFSTSVEVTLNELIKILENPRIKKTGHNIKYDYQVFQQQGVELRGIAFDSMIASYLLNPGSRSHSLDSLAFTEFGHQMIPIESLIGPKGKKQKTMLDVPAHEVAEYAAEDADITWRLYVKLSKNKDLKHLNKVFNDIEMPLVSILGDMELAGIKLDVGLLNKLSKRIGSRIKTIEKNIYKLAGAEFNVASPVQLKEILFEKLKISTEGLSRTKTGVSTSAADLEKLQGKHKIIDYIMEFRELSKLKNTYTDALPGLVKPETGRVHTSFNQAVAATGRLSSSNPNLQNIPIRTDLGMEIRKAFIPDEGFELLSADYSQIELRVVASLANDKSMLDSFKKGEDIHQRTAAQVYGIPLEKVTRQQRREAKEVNFGILYGLGIKGLSQRAQIPYARAKEFYNKYFELHPQIQDYLKSVIETTRNLGYAETLFGRRRYFPDIEAEHPMLRSAAERAATNLPIQGTAADLLKLAMVAIADKIKKENLEDEVRMLLQVHDELVFEVKKPKVKQASKLIKNTMEGVVDLKVPIEAEVGTGKNWAECK